MGAVAPPTRVYPFKTGADGKQGIPVVQDELYTATFTIGTEADNVINVAIQLLDGAGNEMAQRSGIMAYLSDDANGDSITGTGPSSESAIGTDGVLGILLAKKIYFLVSESDGDIDIDITETGDTTWYLVLVMPDGHLVVSDAIDFD